MTVAGWTGLHLAPYQVFLKTMEIVDQFIGGADDSVSVKWDMFTLAREIIGRPKRPIGASGEVLVQRDR